MKKILLALAVLAVAAATSFAGVGINWYVNYGVYDHNAVDLSGATGAIGDNYAVTWQLIYAGVNNLADAPGTSLGGAGIADDYVTGDDVVWGSRTIPVGGGLTAESGDGDLSFDMWLLANGGSAADMVYENLAWNTAGYVYQRIYENPVQANAWYFQTDLVALDTSFTGGTSSPIPVFGGQKRIRLTGISGNDSQARIELLPSAEEEAQVAVTASVSTKPFIYLLWIGAVAASVGCFVAMRR